MHFWFKCNDIGTSFIPPLILGNIEVKAVKKKNIEVKKFRKHIKDD